jgi:hypothetical protein
MKTKLLFTILSFLLTAFLTFAQSDNSIKEKLKDVKEAKKIVITTEKGDVVFEGDESKKIIDKIKSGVKKRIKIVTDGNKILTEDIEGVEDENVIIWKTEDGEGKIFKNKGNGNKIMMFRDYDKNISLLKDKKIINVNVEEENEKKTVTVKTIENGEEKVETYKGKEADDFLEKMEKENEMFFEIDFDSDDDFTWVSSDADSNQIEKKVEVKVENGKKKVILTTIKNGEESVKVFGINEADEYLKSEKEEE